MKSSTRSIIVAVSLGVAAVCGVVATPADSAHHTVVPGDSIKWGPAPPSLPPGAQAATLLGSPAKEGPFVMRLKFPAGFIVPPHRHSRDEFVVVLSGKMTIQSGDKVDRASLKGLPPATFMHLPAGMSHYA